MFDLPVTSAIRIVFVRRHTTSASSFAHLTFYGKEFRLIRGGDRERRLRRAKENRVRKHGQNPTAECDEVQTKSPPRQENLALRVLFVAGKPSMSASCPDPENTTPVACCKITHSMSLLLHLRHRGSLLPSSDTNSQRSLEVRQAWHVSFLSGKFEAEDGGIGCGCPFRWRR